MVGSAGPGCASAAAGGAPFSERPQRRPPQRWRDLRARSRRSAAAQQAPRKRYRQYEPETLRQALRILFAEGVSVRKAALRVGEPTMLRTIQRYACAIRQDVDLLRNSSARTRAARLARIDELLLKQQGNPEWSARRMFSKDALDFFARVVKLYAKLGWPLDRKRAPSPIRMPCHTHALPRAFQCV